MSLAARAIVILLSTWLASAHAQSAAPDHSRVESPAGPSYHSAFRDYRPFAEHPTTSWRESNDLVGRIGGWQAYARESQAAAGNAPSASGSSVAKPAAKAPLPEPRVLPKQ
jgi:hypothetical protein